MRERLHGQLMLALYRSGRQTAALAVFRRLRKALDEELGLEPDPDLKELEQAMLRQDTALRVEPAELRVRRHLPGAQTQLVGRRRELDEIGALLRGGARLVTLTGRAGPARRGSRCRPRMRSRTPSPTASTSSTSRRFAIPRSSSRRSTSGRSGGTDAGAPHPLAARPPPA